MSDVGEWKPIIQPIEPVSDKRPIVTLTPQAILTSEGEILRTEHGPRKELATLFKKSPPTIFVADRAIIALGELVELFSDDKTFQYHLYSLPRYAFNPEWEKKGIRAVTEEYVVNRIGFLAHSNENKARWHLLLDFFNLAGGSPETIIEGDKPRIYKMMQWANVFHRHIIQQFNIRWHTSNGGTAGALLRSPRFYPRPRRKVPRETNERLRPELRGNHFDYRADPNVQYENVLEVDQRAAHHDAAASLTFPHADSLFAHYFYRSSHRGISHTSRHFERIISDKPGILLVELSTPHISPKLFAPRYVGTAKPVYVYTNEIPYLRELGIEPIQVFATWTGEPEPEGEGIRAYADYCLMLERSLHPSDYKVIKRTLLTLYGVLGAREKELKRYFHQSRTHTDTAEIRTGHKVISSVVAPVSNIRPFTANVLQRGMIEAETMFRSLSLANEMVKEGHEVLAIYADALYMRIDGTIPLLPKPWRVKSELKYAQFPRTTVVIAKDTAGNNCGKFPGHTRKAIFDEGVSPNWVGRAVRSDQTI